MRARTPVDLGLLIRARRKALGLDQRELASRVGASRQWLIDVEKGKSGVELGLVLRALQALDLVLDVAPAKHEPAATRARPRVDLDALVDAAKAKR